MNMNCKVRFAPSPTGFLHAGNIRIAILNYLFAKKNSGIFVLRIDDTDFERSTKESEDLIIEDLKWLGIIWDEFYKQSNHIDHYNRAFEFLKSKNLVYPCYETKEDLDVKRKLQVSQGKSPIYDRESLYLSTEQKQELENKGIKPYWRFKLDEMKIVSWMDLVHSNISIPLNTLSDPVIVKPDGGYVYTFASVVDDINIGISHIIRGDDHITNTAVQVQLFNALNNNLCPTFAHIPLMSSLDGEEVSKRTGSSLSIVNMRKSGFFPQAIINVLATIGSSHSIDFKDDMQSLIEKFDFKNMSLSSPKFAIHDIDVINKKIIANTNFNEIKNVLHTANFHKIDAIIWDLIKENISYINEVEVWNNVFFGEIEPIKEDKQFVFLMQKHLNAMSDTQVIDFDNWIENIKKETGKKGKELFYPIRTVITGLENGPELKKIIALLDISTIKKRIENSLEIS